jgi:type IV secretion system protein VirD4
MDYAKFRQGSAQSASLSALRRSRIADGIGIWFGRSETGRHDLCVPNDGSVALFGGAGSGKSASVYAHNLLLNTVGNAVTFDPRGELTAISMLAASVAGNEVFTINPTGMLGFERYGTNPLDHLTLDSPSLIADAQKAAMDFCPASVGRDGKSKWWEADAQDWLTNLILYDVEQHG